ncbi:MAG: MBL fold metallo-hydrolase [Pseudomonadota bacterium]
MIEPTRRDLVKTVGVLAGLGLGAAPVLRNQAWAGGLRETGYYRYRVGDIACTALYDGIWRKAHAEDFIRNASVDETKRALARGDLPSTHVTIEFVQTLIEVGDRTILIDPGTGGQWVPTAGTMPQNLRAAGFAPEAVDTILISHFHPDHIFGLMAPDSDAQVFPDAEIMVPEAEYAFWTDPATRSRLPEVWHPLVDRIQRTFPHWSNVRRFDGDVELVPGVRGLCTPGHTPGHTSFHVSSGPAELIVAGDVAITPALFVANPDWHVVFDANPDRAEQTRRRLLDRVTTDGIAIAGYHFGFPNVGRMSKSADGYRFEPYGI